ncbi:hypothetical protein EFP84_06975 [Leptospira kmetyi]|uniref:Uncharacterized protein n=1 Tax=Leptospira kmetyi TaxID=408139 RepID=A0AAD0UMZ0_9LEPT|nr:hypothetical protein EFP84_06975 [Leptospira kmetyi]
MWELLQVAGRFALKTKECRNYYVSKNHTKILPMNNLVRQTSAMKIALTKRTKFQDRLENFD